MLSLIFAGLLAADVPATSPLAAPLSPQAAFDAATDANDAGRFEEAARGFAALEQLPGVRRNPVVLSTLLMRKGRALVVLDRDDEAEAALRAGLKLVPLDRTDLRNDRFLAELALGNIALRRFNYAAATEHHKAALALAGEPSTKARALLALTRSTMFDPGVEALQYADQALALLGPINMHDEKEKAAFASIQTLRARALLNQQRYAEAYTVLKKAVEDQGGLDLKVTLGEIITRSDLAIASLLSGNKEDARRYMAYTGAGRMKEPFDLAASLAVPPCGGPAQLRPDDVAVVEFGIRPDGSIASAEPIYSSVKGQAVLEFARAVSDWSWRPDAVAQIPDAFRLVTRVELRCSTSAERPRIDQLLTAELLDWFEQSGFPRPQGAASDAGELPILKAELARREAAGDGPALIPVLTRLGGNAVASNEDRSAWLIRARDMAIRAGAPLAAVIALEVRLPIDGKGRDSADVRAYRNHLRALAARPGVSENPRVANILRIMTADPIWRERAPADAESLLRQVVTDRRLEPRDPLRVAALIRLAAIRAAEGDRRGAADNFAQTGLSAQQCALLDAKPRLIRNNVGSSDFPMEAMRWGFEGWVRIEYDILAEGRTAAQRAIVAYPPFVFRDAAVGIAQNLTYAKSYRPDGSAGCGGAQENVRFQIP